MRVGTGEHTYEWIGDWAQIPDGAAARDGWAHPGIAVGDNGTVYTFHPGEPSLLLFAPDGRLIGTIPTDLTEGHGITVTREADGEYIWITDPGSKAIRIGDELRRTATPGRVIKTALDGRVVFTLAQPDLPVYAEAKYAPTSIAVFEERHGGNGDIWVADGYGQNYVHRYSRFDRHGRYLGSINGTEGAAGGFATPHGVWIDSRKPDPELYIADRRNRRVQVYDMEGVFKRSFGETFLTTPSGFARDGDFLIVGELRARLAVLDGDDRLVCYLGDNEAVCDLPGWPNELDARGVPARTTRLVDGKFNSPHGLAADSAGNLYVAEWLIGGRFTKLAKAPA